MAISTAGHQAGSAYNGHFGERVYYPLVASIGETGDLIGALLRDGRAHPAADAPHWIPSVVDQAKRHLCQVGLVRMDAGFTDDTTLSALEARDIAYVGRLRGNKALDRLAAPHLKRPVGRPPHEPREWAIEQRYQAGSWDQERRAILVVQERPDELFLHACWLVTSLDAERDPPERVLALYRERGRAESHMGELKDVLVPRLSATSRGAATDEAVFTRNEAWLLLHLIAYQAMHALRVALERATGEGVSLKRLRERPSVYGSRCSSASSGCTGRPGKQATRPLTIAIEPSGAARFGPRMCLQLRQPAANDSTPVSRGLLGPLAAFADRSQASIPDLQTQQ